MSEGRGDMSNMKRVQEALAAAQRRTQQQAEQAAKWNRGAQAANALLRLFDSEGRSGMPVQLQRGSRIHGALATAQQQAQQQAEQAAKWRQGAETMNAILILTQQLAKWLERRNARAKQ